MTSLITRFVAAVILFSMLSTNAVANKTEESQFKEARIVLKKFVEHTEAILPISGDFTLTHISDLESWVKIRNAEENRAPGRVILDPPASTNHCRWGRTAEVETLETLPESDVWHSFYRFPGGILDGNSPTNFNLMVDRDSADIRPENFYLTLGNLSWRDFLENGQVTDFQRDEVFESLHGISAVRLVVAAEGEVATLTIDENSRLWKANIVVNNTVAVELEVEGFVEQDDGRCFPKAATNRLLILRTGTVRRANTMTADKITFVLPEDAKQITTSMKLPAGCEVFDLQKKKKLTLEKPESASNVARGRGDWNPY